MDPVTAALIGGGISTAAGLWGANEASNAQGDAAKRAAATAQRNALLQLRLQEPYRNVGYQALGDLASVYGYSVPQYTSLEQASAANSPLSAKGVAQMLRQGYTVDEIAQMGTLNQSLGKKDLKRLNYLTPEQMATLQGRGASATPAATSAPQQPGQAGNFSRFFASPDYQFRRTEGQRGLEQSAAARGGAFSGNALKALSGYNSNLAAGEFGNWFNRVAQLAGYGTGATSNVSNTLNQNTQAQAASQLAQGDARASGIMGGVNSFLNGLGGLAQWYGQYGQRDPSAGLYAPTIYRQRM